MFLLLLMLSFSMQNALLRIISYFKPRTQLNAIPRFYGLWLIPLVKLGRVSTTTYAINDYPGQAQTCVEDTNNIFGKLQLIYHNKIIVEQ